MKVTTKDLEDENYNFQKSACSSTMHPHADSWQFQEQLNNLCQLEIEIENGNALGNEGA